MIGLFHFKYTPNHHRSTVLDKHLRTNMFSIYRHTLIGAFPPAILVHIQIEDNISLRGNLRGDFEFQNRFLKRNRGSTIWCGY
ncbi:hypothetical protein OX89_13445 [Diaphorobacter sp. J5-51]|nr:hypothetical protein OX89_13445 [Diaphorobacter sp. J5-51]